MFEVLKNSLALGFVLPLIAGCGTEALTERHFARDLAVDASDAAEHEMGQEESTEKEIRSTCLGASVETLMPPDGSRFRGLLVVRSPEFERKFAEYLCSAKAAVSRPDWRDWREDEWLLPQWRCKAVVVPHSVVFIHYKGCDDPLGVGCLFLDCDVTGDYDL